MKEIEQDKLSLNELILSFHAGKPYMMWIRFNEGYGEQPCAQCRVLCRSLVMTSPTGGVCDACWDMIAGA